MAYSRYEDRRVIVNNKKLYQRLLDERNMKKIRHFETPNLNYPSPAQFSELDVKQEVWKYGSRYWKLAEQEYGDASLWWVIAFFNKKPTEADLSIGDTILIPHPLEKLLTIMGL